MDICSDKKAGYVNRLPRVAYFCMEYGLHPEFPIYSGGLGILAGDHIKSAGDLGLPLVAFGLLWRHGYTQQFIGADGRPFDTYPRGEFDFLKDTGVTVQVEVRGQQVACKVWRVDKYGNAPLYLLDTEVPGNAEPWITGYLYGGYGPADRLAQEIVLGIGGIRALRALGLEVDVYHFNEGHAVLAATELIREQRLLGRDFAVAWEAVRRQIVFTTHTPVPAGNESHDLGLMAEIGACNGLTREEMARLGGDPFNMTVAGLRVSRLANGVAALHGETARAMWSGVPDAAPITSVTNGVHPRTWQDPALRQASLSGDVVWTTHQAAKSELLAEVALRTGQRLRPDVLTIGFARRAATYKRADLIFRRPEVIEPLLHEGKLQIIFSGKAHPRDEHGKDLLAGIVAIAARYPGAVVFLQNYDMRLGQLLTRGCDVWLNTPRRPQEASGTSGMKAAMNGVLNLSVLDGWWPECCRHGENGWAVGEGCEGENQDERDVASLYALLLGEVVPRYYGDHEGWVRMMRHSIEASQYHFSSDRMVTEYFQRIYPAWAGDSAKLTAQLSA